MTDRARFPLLLACFLLSGFAGLVYETAWTQELALVFGTSEPAVAAVLAAYMAGLALGAAAAGRWLHRVRRPVLLYALIELGIGAAALAVPLGLAAARRLQVQLLGGLDTLPEGGGMSSTLFYVCTAFVVLLVPTTLMGATLPLLVRYAVREDRQIGARTALLYAVNTVGAALGALGAAFLLLPALALGATVLVGVAVNVLVFVLAAVLAAGDRSREEPEAVPVASRTGRWILPAVLISGAVAFSYEILWVRLLTHVLGGSAFAFGTMLATFLAGIALGSAAAGRLATSRERSRLGFAWAQIAVAGLSLLAFAALDRLPALARELAVGAASLAGGVTLSAATLLPGALAMGATFPFAVRILSRDAHDTAPAAARVYAWNTTGAIVGALGAGFVLLPALGMARAAGVLAATSLLLAAAAGLLRPRARIPVLVAVAALVLVVARPPATPWSVLTHSVLQTADGLDLKATGDVVFHRVGQSATVLVAEQAGEWRLTTNGLPESVIQPAGARPGRYQVARWLSLLPLAVRPDTRTMLIVGLGAGNTIEYVPRSVEALSVVELEPEVVEANRFIAERRALDPLADPRVRLHLNDARGALSLTEQRFDAIVSQPSHPWTAGASHLFTHEFFTLARGHLAPGGVFLQWIGLAFVDEDLIRTLVATLGDVFPQIEVYRPTQGALLFLGSDEPLRPALTAGRSVAAAGREWSVVGVLDGEDVVATRVLDDAGARSFAAGAPLNTDRRNLLKTRSPRILHQAVDRRPLVESLGPHDALLTQRLRHPLYTVRQLLRRGQVARVTRLAARLPDPADRATAQALVDLTVGRRKAAEQTLQRVLAASPGHDEAYAALALVRRHAIVQGRAPQLARLATRDPAAAVLDGWARVQAKDWGGLRALEPRLAAAAPLDPLFAAARRLRVEWRLHAGEPSLAIEAIELLDPLMVPAAQTADLLLRAELGRLAGDPGVSLASLAEIVHGRVEEPFVGPVAEIFAALPQAAQADPRHRVVAAKLREIRSAPPQSPE